MSLAQLDFAAPFVGFGTMSCWIMTIGYGA